MVKSCCAVGCANRFATGSNIGFHKYPLSNQKKLARWIAATKRKNWAPNKHSYICGQHFQTGKPSQDPDHPDFIPNVFVFSKGRKRNADIAQQRKARALTRENSKKKNTATLQKQVEHHIIDIEHQDAMDGSIEAQDNNAVPELVEEQVQETEMPQEQGLDVDKILEELHKVVKINSDLKTENDQLRSLNTKMSKRVGDLECILQEANVKIVDLTKRSDELERKNIVCNTILVQNECLTKSNTNLTNQNIRLSSELEAKTSKFVTFLDEKENCKFYTGLPDKSVFDVMLKHVVSRIGSPKKEFKKVNNNQKFLIVLMKIRLNLKNKMLADIFDVSEGYVGRLFTTWIPHVAATFSYLIEWPTKESISNSKPQCFKGTPFENCTVIIDCFEVRTQKPTNHEAQTLVFSAYKNHQTIKFLVAIAPNGTIIFISDAWGGHSSDKEITLKSGLLDLLKPHDVVLADKGFLVHDEFIKAKVRLVMPAFKAHDAQLTSAQVMHSQNVSNLRIHVERVIGQLRNFKILNDIVSTRNFKTINHIVRTCSGIVNLNPPIIK